MLRLVVKTTDQSISISSTYILFLTKLQKSKHLKKDSPLLKNDITRFFIDMTRVLNSKYQRFGVDDFISKSQSYYSGLD